MNSRLDEQEVSDSVRVVVTDGKTTGVKDLPTMTDALMSNDPVSQFEATQHFRRLLSIAQDPPIQAVIECNVVPRIVEFLDYHHNPDLQFEAAWSLTNIAAGSAEQTRIVVDSQAIPKLVSLLLSPKCDVVEQAIWVLANIAGDSPQCRDLVLQAGCLQALIKVLEDPVLKLSLGVLRRGAWALSNLCRGKPEPAASAVLPALPTIRNLLLLQDSEVLQCACSALSYISDGSDPRCIQELIQSGVCPRLIRLADHITLVRTPALRGVRNIVEALRNRDLTQTVMDANMIPSLLHILTTADFEIKREAARAISSASEGNIPQVEHMVSCGCIKPLCDLLEDQDRRVVKSGLRTIENIIETGRQKQQMEGTIHRMNKYVLAFELAGVFPKLEKLLHSHYVPIECHQMACRLMDELVCMVDIPRCSVNYEWTNGTY